MIDRRSLLGVSMLVGSMLAETAWPRYALAAPDPGEALADLERVHGGRLGVAILDAVGTPITYRGDERFALCSTFKVLAAGYVLARADRREENLDRRINYGREALLPYAPVTREHVDHGMTVGALCQAAVTLSDNTAANLLLASFGGPAALTAWLRSTGDTVTRLDNTEPVLNDVPPGQVHDTTTPLAMAETLRHLLFGDVLSDASRACLVEWMRTCRTGDTQLRAGVPPGWRVGDKTGSFRTTVNDVAALWPPQGRPRLVTAYYVGGSGSDADRKAVLAAVGRIASRI